MKTLISKISLILAVICIIVYVIWVGTININNWNVPLTRWQNFKLCWEPSLCFGLPAIIFYVVSIFTSKKH